MVRVGSLGSGKARDDQVDFLDPLDQGKLMANAVGAEFDCVLREPWAHLCSLCRSLGSGSRPRRGRSPEDPCRLDACPMVVSLDL